MLIGSGYGVSMKMRTFQPTYIVLHKWNRLDEKSNIKGKKALLYI